MTTQRLDVGCGYRRPDRDGLPDVYVANDFGPDHLLYNESTPETSNSCGHRKRTPTTPKSFVLGKGSFKAWGRLRDLSGNGKFDMMVSNITTAWA